MNSKFSLKSVILFAVVATAASATWADPTVDGEFDPNEYTDYQNGIYSRCYYKIGSSGDFYVFLDWYNPMTNYDPDTCDDCAIFTWDSPADYRLLVRADSTGWLQKKISGVWTTVTNDCDHVSNYTTTPVEGTDHPVWEIMIPASRISTGACVEYYAPKNGCDSQQCECWDVEFPVFGSGPPVCY